MVGIAEFPEQDELVLAVIKKIMPYGAFCVLPEYKDMEAFVHISDVAPRWIKNIHEFISEGQKHVAKVVRIDRTKNQVDISLKKVNEQEKKNKLEALRTEKKAQKILEVSINASKADITLQQATEEIEKKYDDVYECLEEASEKGVEALEGVNIPKALKEQIAEIVKKNIRKQVIEVSGLAKITCYSAEGIETIKEIISETTKGSDKFNVHYLGAPTYKITLTAEDYKNGEKELLKAMQKMEKLAKSQDCDFSFEKQE